MQKKKLEAYREAHSKEFLLWRKCVRTGGVFISFLALFVIIKNQFAPGVFDYYHFVILMVFTAGIMISIPFVMREDESEIKSQKRKEIS